MQVPHEETAPAQKPSGEPFGTLPEDPILAAQGDAGAEAQTLQRVRELLFGQASSELHQRLACLEADMKARMEAMERDFAERVQAAEADLRAEWKAEVTALASKLDDQHARKVERADLKGLLNDLAQRLGD